MNTRVNQANPAVTECPAATEPADHPIFTALGKLERYFDLGFRALMIFAGLALAVLMFAQVVMRYGFDSPFSGIEEVAILLGVWIYFLGMGYATRTQEHIHGGIVSLVVKDPFKMALVRFFSNIVCVIAAGVFGYFAIKYSLFVLEKGRLSLYLRWPKGLWSASMIAGFSMMTGYFLVHAVNELRGILRMRHRSQ